MGIVFQPSLDAVFPIKRNNTGSAINWTVAEIKQFGIDNQYGDSFMLIDVGNSRAGLGVRFFYANTTKTSVYFGTYSYLNTQSSYYIGFSKNNLMYDSDMSLRGSYADKSFMPGLGVSATWVEKTVNDIVYYCQGGNVSSNQANQAIYVNGDYDIYIDGALINKQNVGRYITDGTVTLDIENFSTSDEMSCADVLTAIQNSDSQNVNTAGFFTNCPTSGSGGVNAYRVIPLPYSSGGDIYIYNCFPGWTLPDGSTNYIYVYVEDGVSANVQHEAYYLKNVSGGTLRFIYSSPAYLGTRTYDGHTYYGIGNLNVSTDGHLPSTFYFDSSKFGDIYWNGTKVIPPVPYVVGNGGGATHIAKRTGQLADLSSYLSDVLIVAGGGGGGLVYNNTIYNGADAGGMAGNGTNSGTQSTGYAFGLGGAIGGGGGLYGGYAGGGSTPPGPTWDGSEIAIIWSGDDNKMTAQVSNSQILFKLYENNTAIYTFASPVGSSTTDIDKIHVSFLKDDINEMAKPSFIYETATGVYSYNQESPTNAQMGDIYSWLYPTVPLWQNATLPSSFKTGLCTNEEYWTTPPSAYYESVPEGLTAIYLDSSTFTTAEHWIFGDTNCGIKYIFDGTASDFLLQLKLYYGGPSTGIQIYYGNFSSGWNISDFQNGRRQLCFLCGYNDTEQIGSIFVMEHITSTLGTEQYYCKRDYVPSTTGYQKRIYDFLTSGFN